MSSRAAGNPGGRWPLVESVYQRAELLTELMQLIGISPLTAARLDEGFALIKARRNCLVCPLLGACRDKVKSSKLNDGPLPLCANKEFLERCRANSRKTRI